jgi:hypothetical protein
MVKRMIWSKSLLVAVVLMVSILSVGSIVYVNYVGALNVTDSDEFLIEEMSAKTDINDNSDPIIYDTKANTEYDQIEQTTGHVETVETFENVNPDNDDPILEDTDLTTFINDKDKQDELEKVEPDDIPSLKFTIGPPITPNEKGPAVLGPTVKCIDGYVPNKEVVVEIDVELKKKDIGSPKELNGEPVELDIGGKSAYNIHVHEVESAVMELEQTDVIIK